MKTTVAGLWCILGGLLTMIASADTHYVAHGGQTPYGSFTNWDTAASNIQDAVGAAAAGDTVLVSNGVYDAGGTANGRVDITSGKNNFTLTAVSANPYDTTINGGGTNRCINSAGTNVLIGGFVVTNGAVSGNGGGIYNSLNSASAKLVITNCVIAGNRADNESGGGICALFANVTTVKNCMIAGNIAKRYGGGVYVCVLTNNCRVLDNQATNTASGTEARGGGIAYSTMYGGQIAGNYAYGYGGGAYNSTVYDCTISNNSAPRYAGGGAAAYDAAANTKVYGCSFYNNTSAQGGALLNGIASNCTFVGNCANGLGGAVAASYSGASLIGCTISGNVAASHGGGLAYWSATPTAERCIIVNNTASNGSGGAYAAFMTNCLIAQNIASNDASAARNCTIVNCTIVSNRAMSIGKPIPAVLAGTLTNCIVWMNYTAEGVISNYSGSPVFSYSCADPLPTGDGNISAEPQFENFDEGKYRLTSNSRCVDAGTNSAWMLDAKDVDARPRIDRLSGRVDMGSYELMHNGAMFAIH